MRLPIELRNEWLDRLNARIGPGGKAKAYGPPRPATPEDPVAGDLLIEMALDDTPLEAASNGQAAFRPIANTVAVGTGTVAHVRIEKADGTCVLDLAPGEVTMPGGGAVLAGLPVTDIVITASIPLGS